MCAGAGEGAAGSQAVHGSAKCSQPVPPDHHQQWTDCGLQGISPQQNTQYHAFINKLEQAATQQYEGVLQVRQALEQRREEWLAAQQRRKAVELLLEKQASREQQKAQRQEQKMLDEYAMLRRFHQSGL